MVIDYVCDPRTGIVGKNKWIPSVAEIREACESKLGEISRSVEREERIQRQFKERDEDEILAANAEARMVKAQAWLDRAAPQAEEMGLKPKVLTEEQKKAALEDAALVGKSIFGMKLLPETLKTIILQTDLPASRSEETP